MKPFPQTEIKAPSADYIASLRNHMKAVFAGRNAEFAVLRRAFDGKFEGSPLGANVNSPDGKPEIIYNIANATIRRYLDSMSAPPRLEAMPEGFDMGDIELADKKTKWLEHIFNEERFTLKLMHIAFYQALLDKAIIHVRPAPLLKHGFRIEIIAPEHYFPMVLGDDYAHPEAVIVSFNVHDPMKMEFRTESFDPAQIPQLEVIEYWDKTWMKRTENGKVTMEIKHDFGILPFFEVHNLPIPHQHRGQGDIDHVIGLNDYLNRLFSDLGAMIDYAANPIAIIRGSKAGGANLPFAPRAVWELERDAQASFLQWQGAPPSVEAQMLRTLQAVEDVTGVSSPAFGRDIPSGTSDRAIRSILAGFNTRLGTKQQLLAMALQEVSNALLHMAGKLYPAREYAIVGENTKTGPEMGKKIVYSVKPGEFGEYNKTRITFLPSDPSSLYFQEIDKMGKGIQSKYTTMKNLGVQFPFEEMERMRLENEANAEMQNQTAQAQQGNFVSPNANAKAEAGNEAALGSLMEQLKGVKPPSNPGADMDLNRETAEKVQSDAGKPVEGLGVPQQGGGEQPLEPMPTLENPSVTTDDIIQAAKQATLSGRARIVTQDNPGGKPANPKIALENMADAESLRQALGAAGKAIEFVPFGEPSKPAPSNTIELMGQKKKIATGVRTVENAFLNVVVMDIDRNNRSGIIFKVGILDDQKRLVPLTNTNPQRRVMAEKGEIIRMKIEGVSKKEDNGVKWSVAIPTVVPSRAAAATPSSFMDLGKLFDGGKE